MPSHPILQRVVWVQRRASRPQDLGIGITAAPPPARRPKYTFGLTLERLHVRGCDTRWEQGAAAEARAASWKDAQVRKLVTVTGASIFCDDEQRGWNFGTPDVFYARRVGQRPPP